MSSDYGAEAMWAFCVWCPGDGVPVGRPVIAFARDGDPNRIVDLSPVGVEVGSASRVRVVDRLTWYAQRKPSVFHGILVRAGRSLQLDYEYLDCAAGPFVMDYGRPVVQFTGVPGVRSNFDVVLAVRDRFERALDYVGGPELDRLLVSIVCRGDAMAAFERRYGYPGNSGQVALKIGLHRLAVHMGFVSSSWRTPG